MVHNIERAKEANFNCIIDVIYHDGMSYADRPHIGYEIIFLL